MNAGQARDKLERRARALLRAYPAQYRQARGEEIIGTLLEATPPGRSFPLPRDAWALVKGGRHARAARNRRLSAAESLRLAVLLGLAVFVARSFYYPSYYGYDHTGGFDVAMGAGILAGLAPWVPRRVLGVACVIPAGVLFCYVSRPRLPFEGPAVAGRMALFLCALVALALWRGRGARLPRSWAGLACATPVLAAVPWLRLLDSDSTWPVEPYWLTVALLVAVAACWLATDARPAFGVVFALVLSYSVVIVTNLSSPGTLFYTLTSVESLRWLVSPVAACVVLTVALAVLLRRQAKTGERPPG